MFDLIATAVVLLVVLSVLAAIHPILAALFLIGLVFSLA
jgi:hypothetical protein